MPRGAGPPFFSPTRLYCEPWHGHSNHCEVSQLGTRQPRCGHFWYSATTPSFMPLKIGGGVDLLGLGERLGRVLGDPGAAFGEVEEVRRRRGSSARMSSSLPTVILEPKPPPSFGHRKPMHGGAEAAEADDHQRDDAAVEELAAGDADVSGSGGTYGAGAPIARRHERRSHGPGPRRGRRSNSRAGRAASDPALTAVARSRFGLARQDAGAAPGVAAPHVGHEHDGGEDDARRRWRWR